jgi:hypothetical protein
MLVLAMLLKATLHCMFFLNQSCVFISTDILFHSIEANDPTTSVTFSDIRIGDIGSTFSAGRRGYKYYA